MFYKSLFFAFVAINVAFADSGIYKGKGSGGAPGKARSFYETTLEVNVIKEGELAKVKETYQEKELVKGKWKNKGEPKSFELSYEFSKDGTLKVRNKGVVIGCGYCVKDEKGKWCDYKIQVEKKIEGKKETTVEKLHVNSYYSKKEQTLVRMGDIVGIDGVKIWSDELKLAN